MITISLTDDEATALTRIAAAIQGGKSGSRLRHRARVNEIIDSNAAFAPRELACRMKGYGLYSARTGLGDIISTIETRRRHATRRVE